MGFVLSVFALGSSRLFFFGLPFGLLAHHRSSILARSLYPVLNTRPRASSYGQSLKALSLVSRLLTIMF